MHQDSATTRTQGAFAWTVEPGPGSISAARQAFVTWLLRATSDDELVEDMSVVVSELASNALDGAGPDTGAEVRAQLDGEVIDLVVSNQLPDEPEEIRRWDLDDPLRGGGRGLMIVRAYTDTLEVDSAGGTVSVHCTRRLATAP